MIKALKVEIHLCQHGSIDQDFIQNALKEVFGDYLIKTKFDNYNPTYKTSKGKTAIRRMLRVRDGEYCCWCKTPLDFAAKMSDDLAPTIEHIKRRSEGGAVNDLDNLALAHKKCNNERHK